MAQKIERIHTMLRKFLIISFSVVARQTHRHQNATKNITCFAQQIAASTNLAQCQYFRNKSNRYLICILVMIDPFR